jgi:DNA-binding NarL/FixJ family response regulator
MRWSILTRSSVKLERVKVLIVDDHAIVREGLKAVLQIDPRLEVVGESANGRQAIQMARSLRPDVVLMDLIMPVTDGIEATRQIAAQWPASKVLVLSSYPEKDLVERALAAGATGYLLKHSASSELLKAIHQVHRGAAFFSASIARMLSETGIKTGSKGLPQPATQLTPRQNEVLRLIAEGNCNKEIATHLDISIKTVEKHRQELMTRLNIHTIAGLTRYALAKGFVSGERAKSEYELAQQSLPVVPPAPSVRATKSRRTAV